jgi:hypothetical protein
MSAKRFSWFSMPKNSCVAISPYHSGQNHSDAPYCNPLAIPSPIRYLVFMSIRRIPAVFLPAAAFAPLA